MNSIINGWNSTKPVETAYFHCGPSVDYDCPGSILVQVLCRVSVEIHRVHLLLQLDGGVGISEFCFFWRSSKYLWFHRGELFFSGEVQFILCPFPAFEVQDLKKLKNFQSSNLFQYSHFQIQDRYRVDIVLFKEQFLFTSNETQTHEMLSFLFIWWV